jgi:hypothetical protein
VTEQQEPGGQPSEEELRAALEEQLRRITVTDVLLQTTVTLVNLASRRLGLGGGEHAEEEKDLDQARLAIDAIRALVPLLPEKETQPVKDALAQLQMAYAREAQGGPPSEEPPAQSKIWTPPGT